MAAHGHISCTKFCTTAIFTSQNYVRSNNYTTTTNRNVRCCMNEWLYACFFTTTNQKKNRKEKHEEKLHEMLKQTNKWKNKEAGKTNDRKNMYSYQHHIRLQCCILDRSTTTIHIWNYLLQSRNKKLKIKSNSFAICRLIRQQQGQRQR